MSDSYLFGSMVIGLTMCLGVKKFYFYNNSSCKLSIVGPDFV